MKNLTFAVLATVLFLTACSKDDDKTTTPVTGGSFSFNDTTVIANNGYLFNYDGSNDLSIAFTDVVLSDTLKGRISAVSINLDTLISGQTYTYLSNDSAAYNKTKNFNYAAAYYNSEWVNGEIEDKTGRILDGITSGTVTYTKDGDNCSITYTLQFPTAKLTGKYYGKLELRKQ